MSVDWGYYNKFDDILNQYLPDRGQGDSFASQVVTAVTKLVYKWYNDGDVYDNTKWLEGWANDLSSYANWLRKYCGQEVESYLDSIWDCQSDEMYEDLLKNVADELLDEYYLESISEEDPRGDIYRCDGPYQFIDRESYDDEEEDEYYWDDSWEDEEDY